MGPYKISVTYDQARDRTEFGQWRALVDDKSTFDAVYSFFNSIYGTAEAAGNFTVSLFRVAQQSAIPVMDLLQQIQGQSQAELNLTLAYYLNNIRSPATLLGINATTTPNYYVARNVRS